MSDIVDALTHEFLERRDAPARTAFDYFAKASDAAVARTLLDHRHEAIDATVTINRRESFDQLLSYYSLLELAFQQRLIDGLPNALANQARRHLSHTAVRAYYEVHYPLVLPQLLARRLVGVPFMPSLQSFEAERLSRYWAFQDMTRILNDPRAAPGEWTDAEAFLWLLDDGVTEDGYILEDLINAFADEDRVSVALLGADDDWLQACIRGLYNFLSFASEIDPFLNGQDAISASAYWHFHGYWFALMGSHLSRTIERALNQLRFDESREVFLSQVRRLTSSHYASALPTAAGLSVDMPVAAFKVIEVSAGTIKRLVTARGFGFIAAPDGNEYFFHSSAVLGTRYDELKEGQAVSFTVEKGPEGSRAAKIKPE